MGLYLNGCANDVGKGGKGHLQMICSQAVTCMTSSCQLRDRQHCKCLTLKGFVYQAQQL